MWPSVYVIRWREKPSIECPFEWSQDREPARSALRHHHVFLRDGRGSHTTGRTGRAILAEKNARGRRRTQMSVAERSFDDPRVCLGEAVSTEKPLHSATDFAEGPTVSLFLPEFGRVGAFPQYEVLHPLPVVAESELGRRCRFRSSTWRKTHHERSSGAGERR